MLIPDEEPFLLEYEIEAIFRLKSGTIKFFRNNRSQEKHFRGGNGTSPKASEKDCILKLSSDDFSHLSITSHFGSRTDLPASYGFFENALSACLIFLLVSFRCNTLDRDCAIPKKGCRESFTVLCDNSVCICKMIFSLTSLIGC